MSDASPTGVILAAGEGRRMEPIGLTQPKPCLPVCNRPLLHYQLDLLLEMGVHSAVVVVGYRSQAVVDAALAHPGVRSGAIRLVFTEQRERRGIAHALQSACHAVGDHLVVVLADTYFVPGDLRRPLQMLAASGAARCAAVLSVRRVEDPAEIRRECTVRFDEGGALQEIREKPERPFNDLKPCGLYYFDRRIFEAIDRTGPSSLRGEIELTDAIGTLIRMGGRVGHASAVAWDVNLNTPSDLLRCNLAELRRRGERCLIGEGAEIDPAVDMDRVVVGARARVRAPVCMVDSLILDDAVVTGPVDVEGCIATGSRLIRGCIYGPLPNLSSLAPEARP